MTGGRSSEALDFDTAWAALLRQYEPAVRVTSALLKLTGLGEHAVHIELLADAINQPVPDTLNLLTRWTTARVDDRQVGLTLTDAGPSARYRLSVDTRTLDADGCAVDIFWMALVSGKPIRVESVCPATGTPIRVEVDSQQVELVEPGTSVVAVVNPRAPELRSITVPSRRTSQSVRSSPSSLRMWRRPTGAEDTP